jgi:LmbE family N-acetylglucosaminyl deacetylase
MATALFFHAHPDDEAITTGGTMAKLADEGHRVVLVTATGGELGEVPDGLLAPGETLAERRAEELAAACDALGVARHLFLGYRDSGMDGTPANDDPECFWQADVDEAADRLRAVLEEEGAAVLVAYDSNGNYGHPDHIQVHRVGLRAGEAAGVPRVFMATTNRDHLLALADSANELGLPMDDEQRAFIDELGVRDHEITTAVDVSDYLGHKRRAMEVHASQIGDTSFFLSMSPEAFAAVWGVEWFIRVGADVGTGAADRESTLLGPLDV